MLDEIINKVIAHHPYFTYEEVKDICEMFLSEQEKKTKNQPQNQQKKLRNIEKIV